MCKIIGLPVAVVTLIAMIFTVGVSPITADAFAAESGPSVQQATPDAIQSIRNLLAMPDEFIDLAGAKLTIDKLVDPNIDVNASLIQIDDMVQTISSMVPPSATSMQKVAAIRTFIYKPGPWNEFRPFEYDHDDPLGTHLPNKLIPNYIASRKGNCITMPFLFIMLADRMGVKVTASTAPLHVMVRYTDDATGQTYNLETTSGALPARDEWYREGMPMTDQAIQNGVYLQTLSKKETVAVMATLLAEHYLASGQYERAIEAADVVLEYYPKYAFTMVAKGTAYYHLLNETYYKNYPTQRDIPIQLRNQFFHWSESNRIAFETAEALGWRPEGQVR